MPGPFPVRRRRPAAAGTRTLVLGVIAATGEAAGTRAGRAGPPRAPLPAWSPYRLPGGLAQRVVGRLDRLVVERAGGVRAALGSRRS